MGVKKKLQRVHSIKDNDLSKYSKQNGVNDDVIAIPDKEGHFLKLFLQAKDGFSKLKVKSVFSSKSKHIFVGSGSNIQIYSATTGSWIQTLRGHREEIINIFWKDEKKESIISCDESGNVIFWNEDSRKENVFLSPGRIVGFFQLMTEGEFLLGHYMPKHKSQSIFYHQGFAKKNSQCLFKNIQCGPNKISVNRDRSLVAAIRDRELAYSYAPFKEEGVHKMKAHLTCVQCHPFEDMIAVGDELGQITLLYEVYKNKPSSQVLHWHTLPVRDICFSYSGSQLISGGGECVCIQWDLRDGVKHKLPRLGMPIVTISLDEENDYIIVTHSDNGISLVNAHSFSIEGIIAGLTRHIPEVEGRYDLILPAGLHIHPVSKQLILNGRVGHLQFFDFYKNKLICHFDITQTNYLTDERHTKLSNPDVTHIDLSSDGKWMVTCESCIISASFIDIKMKFWEFDEENQRWKLNTRVMQPHDGAITHVKLSPTLPDMSLRCITCGTDGKVNVWVLYNDDKSQKKESNEHWYCFLSEQYLDLTPTCCTFSPDGSLFVVAFGRILTLWENSSLNFLGTLSQSFLKNDIRFVEFNEGSHAGCFLISCFSNWVCCWDILSSKLLWRIQHAVSCIASNPISGLIAIFTEEKEAMLFHPSQCTPVAVLNSFSPNIVIAAKFVPSLDRPKATIDSPWKSNHTLVCIDSEQILYTVEGESTSSSSYEVDIINKDTMDPQWLGATPFSALVSKSQEKINKKLKEDVKNSEMSYTSPDTLIKTFADVQVFNLFSFSSLVKEFSGIVPPAPVTGASSTVVPSYVILDDEEDKRKHEDSKVEVSKSVIKSINYNSIASSIQWNS